MSKALYGMAAFGVGEVIGSFIHGLVIDKLGSKKTVFVNLVIMAIWSSTALFSINRNQFDIYSVLMCFCFGYNDGS